MSSRQDLILLLSFFVLFTHEKYQKCFFCGDLLIGRNSLLKLPDRNGALHPDLLPLHSVVRRSIKTSYRWGYSRSACSIKNRILLPILSWCIRLSETSLQHRIRMNVKFVILNGVKWSERSLSIINLHLYSMLHFEFPILLKDQKNEKSFLFVLPQFKNGWSIPLKLFTINLYFHIFEIVNLWFNRNHVSHAD